MMFLKKISTALFFVFLFATQQTLIAQQLSKEEIAARLQQEKKRNIRLPVTDWHYRMVKHFVEDKPDSDYYHASEDAYEAYRDIKFAVRIHWGLYSINQMNHESWGFLELDNAGKQQYQQQYKTWNPVGFNANEWMDFFQRSGLKCFAFTSKHHEGFSMFDTKAHVKQRVNYLPRAVRL
ncbi:MAG: alpha-L-fucosidase [Agriterribacter sp.]